MVGVVKEGLTELRDCLALLSSIVLLLHSQRLTDLQEQNQRNILSDT